MRTITNPILALLLCASAAGCGEEPGTDPQSVASTTQAISIDAGLANSPPSDELKFLPGIGFMDGTTCDVWPRTLDFKDATATATGVLEDVLRRTERGVQGLRALSQQMANMDISTATAIGSKRRLDVRYGGYNNRAILVAIDTVSDKAYALDTDLLCNEDVLRKDPLNCGERSVQIDGKPYQTLMQTFSWPPDATPDDAPLPMARRHAVALVAPEIRFVAPPGGSPLVSTAHLIAIGERVYGGPELEDPDEDVSQRSYQAVSLSSAPPLIDIGQYPSEQLWRRALITPRRASLLAIVADQVGGLGLVEAESRAIVEKVHISTWHPYPAVYDVGTRTLHLRPETYFQPATHCNRVTPWPNYDVCEYSITLGAPPPVRSAGGSPAAIVLASSTSNFPVQAIGKGSTAVEVPGETLKDFAFELVQSTFDRGWEAYWVLWGNTRIQRDLWLDSENQAHRDEKLVELVGHLQLHGFFGFPQQPLDYPPTALSSTDSLQAQLGANLVSRGSFMDVMYGRAELNSLETGVVSPDWTRAWNMISSIVESETLIAGLDLTRDFAFDADRRRRIEQNALYLMLDIADAELKVNAVGVPYGKNAVGWDALRDNTTSLLAAERRWSELGDLSDDFRRAAEDTNELLEAGELKAIRQLIESLKEGLSGAIDNTTQAAKTLAEASKLNTTAHQDVLAEFQTGYDRLFELNAQHLDTSFQLWGCHLSTDDNCLQTIRNTIDQMEEDCEPETGLDWLKPIVDLITEKIPVLKMTEKALESMTGGKGYVESMEALLLAATPGGATPQAPPTGDAVNVLAADKAFADLERYFDASATFSTAIRSMVERSSSQCSAGGLPLQRFEQFKTNLIDFDDTIQDYANQIRLTHAQITQTLGMISYLTSEVGAYETLQNANSDLQTRLDEKTDTLLDKLSEPGALSYEKIATEQRAFLVNACQHLVAATKTSQADLTLISQALQTSTGRPNTQPHLVVPAKPMYMLDTGNPVQEELEFDREYGFHISAWDASAFRARFIGSGVPSAPGFMSEAVKRFELLMNTQVCSTDGIKPAVQFVVRKVITGQALKTLVHEGKVDFSVSLDDVVRGGNGGGEGASVTARYARDLSTDQLSLELGSPFVVHAGYSVCNGSPGDECANGHRVPFGSAGTVADGKLDTVCLASRGRSYTAIGNRPDCEGGAEPTVSNVALMRDGAAEPISSCLTPQISPRVSTPLIYFADADATDPLLLGVHMSGGQCRISGAALDPRPLQGLPVLGSWALTANEAIAYALSNTTAPAEISDDVLADISGGVTGLEVLFLVAAEPVETSEVGGYGSPDGSSQSSTAYASASLSEDAETVFFEAFDPTPGSSVVGIHAVVYVGGTASPAQFVPGAEGNLSVDPAFSRIEYWAEDSAGNEQARQTLHKYPTTILADEPVAYYRLGESAGEPMALDESVNSRHGTYRGRYEDSFPPRLGKPGAINFDPNTSAEFFWSNNYNHTPPTQWTFVEIPHHFSQVPPARELTLEAWFTLMPGAIHQTYSAIVAKGATNGWDGYGLMYYGHNLWFFVNHYNNRIGFPLPVSGTYHHIVATLNGQDARIYLNGSVVASGALHVPAINAQAGPLNIGKSWLGSWLGMIDEVAVYHHALDERQVTNHYRAGKGLAPLAP